VIARYPLGKYIPTFDFFSWLVLVKAAGATEIVIDTSQTKAYKWTAEQTERRIQSIVIPGPALAGLPSRIGTDGVRYVHPDLENLVAFYRAGGRVEPLISVLPPETARFTVTLRQTQRSQGRNSNEAAWRRFAGVIGAPVIADYDDAPIHLHQRMALYAGAQMNFFVVSGPAHLCMLGGYPCMVFDAQKCEPTLLQNGLKRGENFPWAGPDQHLIWEPDDLPVIEKHFERWIKGTFNA
jgi:hypothetical protein